MEYVQKYGNWSFMQTGPQTKGDILEAEQIRSLENSCWTGRILQHTVLMSFALSSACLPLQMSQFSPLIHDLTINLSNNSLMGWWSLMVWNTVQKLQSTIRLMELLTRLAGSCHPETDYNYKCFSFDIVLTHKIWVWGGQVGLYEWQFHTYSLTDLLFTQS